MKPLSILRPLLLPALSALALHGQAALPESLTRQLQEAACVHLDFVQTRTLAALSRPLKASGSLVLARGQGVIWAVQRPVAITYVMGPQGLLVVNGDGTRERKSAQDSPVVAQMGRIVTAMTRGDWKTLDSLFTVAGTGRPEHWEVTLQPKGPTAAFVKGIRLEGGRFIDRIRMEEPGGDHTELLFQHQRMDAPLSEAERRLLAPEPGS
jgi:hypothetical protein